MKSSRLILLAVLCSLPFAIFSQCLIKSTDQSNGNVTYYLDPELVAQSDEIGVAMSVQMVGGNYYLAITYQFAKRAEPFEEKVAIELQNGYTLELEMYTMQGGSAGGVEIVAAVFNLTEEQINFFTKSSLKAVNIKTQTGKKIDMLVTSNEKMLSRQLKCFGK